MNADRRLQAPGQLAAADRISVRDTVADLPEYPLAEYAYSHGLRRSAVRPPFVSYLHQLWRRRHFILAFATARNVAMYTEARLGQLWQVLTPLLNAGVYFLIFGELLHISKGIPHYLEFLVAGVFVFNFTQRSFISSSTVITQSLPLIRALQFPRASLPLAMVIIEFQQMMVATGVLCVIVLASGQPITWYWLLVIPALLLQGVFNAGAGMFVARIGAQVSDFSQLLPFLMRTWLYFSGVIFSISALYYQAPSIPRWVFKVLELNPAAIYITLVRNALLLSQRLSQFGSKPYNARLCAKWINLAPHAPQYDYDSAYCHAIGNTASHLWLYGLGWAVAAVVVGFVYFWWAEVRYGRG